MYLVYDCTVTHEIGQQLCVLYANVILISRNLIFFLLLEFVDNIGTMKWIFFKEVVLVVMKIRSDIFNFLLYIVTHIFIMFSWTFAPVYNASSRFQFACIELQENTFIVFITFGVMEFLSCSFYLSVSNCNNLFTSFI